MIVAVETEGGRLSRPPSCFALFKFYFLVAFFAGAFLAAAFLAAFLTAILPILPSD
jgi:hypothetical protein